MTNPTLAGSILAPEVKRSGPGMTISGTDRDTMKPIKLYDIRRIWRGELEGGTGTFPFLAQHKDGRVFRLE
jgi:hypothetical protein